jgi:pimeloyl-ACP methyl ester carboxylesterase
MTGIGVARRREFEICVADGSRRLIAEEAGPEDGEVVLFHHGAPGSRRMFDRHIEEGAKRGLRHVAYSRPGYEGSDRLPGRTFADAAAEAAAVADALGVDSFATLGVSGGGGPSLACAALLPDRVTVAASVSALGPRLGEGLDWLRGAAQSNLEEFAVLEAGGNRLADRIREEVREWRKITTVEELLKSFDDLFCEADRDLSEDFHAYQVQGCQRIEPDEIWGWFDDDWAMWRPWGFDLAAISVPVTIWQGGEDMFVPPQNAEWLADQVPGAKLNLLPEEGHLSLVDRHYGTILDDLLACARR